MTPHRISLAGFLCYREAQSAEFDGQSLWMLAGPNGSGKSSLFDAVTFALYGLHRGGKHNADALIHRGSDSLEVEFDFLLDGQRFRAHRTHARQGRPTRRILRWVPERAAWEEVPETSSQTGFDRWVREHIGLTDSTFRASIMLRQGEADRLLTLAPAERLKFLGEIVGLDRYERLHKQADDRYKQARFEADNFQRLFETLPDITAETLAAAEREAAEAAAAAAQADAHVAALNEQKPHADTWRHLQSRRDDLLREDRRLAAVLHDGDAIRTQAERLAFLDHNLHGLEKWLDACRQHRTAESNLANYLREEQTLLAEQRRLAEAAAAQQEALANAEAELERFGEPRRLLDDQHHQLSHALPWLEQLCQERRTIQGAEVAAAEAQQALTNLHAEREQTAQTAPSPADVEAAQQALQQAESHYGEANARRRDAHQRRQRFQEVQHERSCPYCGQNLPHEHVAGEAERLDRECREADAALQEAEAQRRAARTAADQLRKRYQAAESALRDFDQKIQKQQDGLQHAHDRQREAAERTGDARRHLPDHLRRQAETDAAFPACADVDRFRAHAQKLAEQLAELDARTASLRDALQRRRNDLAQHDEKRRNLDAQARSLQREAALAEAEFKHRQNAVAAAHGALPDAWRDWPFEEAAAQVAPLRDEHRALQAAGVTDRLAALQDAQVQRNNLAQSLAEVELHIAAIPAPARREPAAVESELHQAKDEQTTCRQRHRQAEKQLDDLRTRQQERISLDAAFRQADRRRHLWRRLADLLGRSGLQRDLVRSAERQIVEYADAILDRLSGGALHLELSAPADDEAQNALTLAARTPASPTPIDVPFLSGSQRFRVAVALSLAIGQYASHHRRPVRSVIIDEGFGCLDPDNRQTMIQELHNLRAHLDRIILVTHQDDIAQAFPHGYHCHPEHGVTHLIPFHR